MNLWSIWDLGECCQILALEGNAVCLEAFSWGGSEHICLKPLIIILTQIGQGEEGTVWTSLRAHRWRQIESQVESFLLCLLHLCYPSSWSYALLPPSFFCLLVLFSFLFFFFFPFPLPFLLPSPYSLLQTPRDPEDRVGLVEVSSSFVCLFGLLLAPEQCTLFDGPISLRVTQGKSFHTGRWGCNN